jgi:iron complex outermembrane receptor protein
MKQGAKTFFATTALSLSLAAPAFAQQSVDEVIVTARRVEERLQDVPISITVYNQDKLDSYNAVSAKDLVAFTPSLSVNSRFGSEASSFSLRGFVQDQFTAPSVAMYFADVVGPRGASTLPVGEGAGPGSFFDLQNVQVLKGPQGTLFGRNTTGGAILLVPRKPTFEYGGYVEGSLGDFRLRRLQGVVNLPFNDRVSLRLGFDRMKRRGYLNNISGVGPAHFNNIDYVAGRASLLVKLTPDLENYTILTAARSDALGTLGKMGSCVPGLASAGAPVGNMTCAQIAREAPSGDYYTVSNSVADPASHMRQWQAINTTTWEASDNLTIKNIAAYSELKNVARQDIYGTNWIIPPGAPSGVGQALTLRVSNYPGLPLSHQWTATEELQFQGRALDDRLTWQAGGYYETSKPLTKFTGTANPSSMLCTNILALQCISPYGAFGSLSTDLRSYSFRAMAAYAQGTYKLTDAFRLTAGIRYSDDVSKSQDRGITRRFSPTGAVTSTACTSSGATLPDCLSSERQHSKAPTWLINLDYAPNEDLLLYAKYARGYRQGLVNPRGVFPYKSFGPEKVDSYEFGGKMSWGGAYYNDFTNQQIIVAWRQGTLTANVISNTGTSRIWGLEGEASISPFEGLKLDANFAYINTKLTEAALPAPPVPFRPQDSLNRTVPGFPLPFAPEYKASLTATYTLPLPAEAGQVSVAMSYNYTDDYAVIQGPGSRVPSFSVLNANANWRNVGGQPIDVMLFVTNLTDKQYITFLAEVPTLSIRSLAPAEPRMIGMRVKYRFGAD